MNLFVIASRLAEMQAATMALAQMVAFLFVWTKEIEVGVLPVVPMTKERLLLNVLLTKLPLTLSTMRYILP